MKTILLIDDDDQLRLVFALALQQEGYHVIEANSGVAGLEMARRHLPDLILSDIRMPGGDGSTLLQMVRRDPELRSRQMVLMTGRPDLVTPRKGMEEGADDFLVKPVEREDLLRCVKARLTRASVSWRVEDQMLADLRSNIPPQLSHEFFTPMTGVIGLLEILEFGHQEMSPAEMKDIVKGLRQSALRLNRTLRNYLWILDLKSLPTVSNSFLPPPTVKTVISAGVDEVLRMNDRQSDVALQIKDVTLAVPVDHLTRIVEELVDNACKFSRRGTPIKVLLSETGQLVVTDQGRGMRPEDIARIGAFQQFDRHRYEQQGLGLGLVLVQNLAVACNATVAVTSTLGEGTQVCVDFSVPQGRDEPPN